MVDAVPTATIPVAAQVAVTQVAVPPTTVMDTPEAVAVATPKVALFWPNQVFKQVTDRSSSHGALLTDAPVVVLFQKRTTTIQLQTTTTVLVQSWIVLNSTTPVTQ